MEVGCSLQSSVALRAWRGMMAKGFVGLQVTTDPPHAVVAVLDLVDQHGVLQVRAR